MRVQVWPSGSTQRERTIGVDFLCVLLDLFLGDVVLEDDDVVYPPRARSASIFPLRRA